MKAKYVMSILRYQFNRWRIYILFVALAFILKALMFPSLLFNPQIFQDGATNFLQIAIAEKIRIATFLKLDAGYLPLLARLMSIVVYRLSTAASYAAIIQWLVLFLHIAFVSVLLHPVFEKVIPDRPLRFILGLALLSFPDYQSHVLENFTLFGTVFLLFFALLINERKLGSNRLLFFSAVLSALLMASKPFLMAWVPVFLLIAWQNRRDLHRLKFLGPLFFAAIIQAFFMIRTRLEGALWQGVAPQENLNMVQFGLGLVRETFVTLSSIMAWTPLPHFMHISAVFLLLLFVFWGTCRVFKRKSKTAFFFLLACWGVGFFSLVLRVAAQGYAPITWESLTSLQPLWGRHYLTAYLAFSMAACITLRHVSKTGVCLAASLMIIRGISFSKDPFPDPSTQVSQWSSYSSLLKKANFCIPANSLSSKIVWFVTKDCRVLNENPVYGDAPINIPIVANGNLDVPVNGKNSGKIIGALFRLESEAQKNAKFDFVAETEDQAVVARQFIANGYRFRSYFFEQALQATSLKRLRIRGDWKGASQIYLLGM